MIGRNAGSTMAGLGLMALALFPAQAQEAATGRLQGLSLSNGLPIQIESDRLEVLDGESKAVFMGNVNVTQGPTMMKAGKMTVFYAADGKGGSAATGSAAIDHLDIEDKVYIKSDTQVATGDSASFDMTTQTLVLSGREVVLSEGENVLVGCKLTVDMKSGKATVDGCKAQSGGGSGRVVMKIQPKTQPKP